MCVYLKRFCPDKGIIKGVGGSKRVEAAVPFENIGFLLVFSPNKIFNNSMLSLPYIHREKKNSKEPKMYLI